MKTLILFTACLMWAAPQTEQPKPSRQTQKAKQTTMTGCVDERGERYVLSSESDMSKLTTLKGKAFSDDNFARYVGHKVTVHGSLNGESFEVTKIDNISDTCAR
jgi:hypothetical protein